ncbi:phage portal protein [Parvularcula flava]|uniref:Phage portal protein n=1 Tax=Aquisalinus luteolus TaxID=1566827 RepID=A0A8J3A6S0_9PROT|nr:phage portal protein [Aquisalinus luteolus]NHK27616.1 phage portal protein [Aquisalinus luteolus]GGH95975.1 hypothetical protein GCM10011355_13790 [Aquisalinus luteolus]
MGLLRRIADLFDPADSEARSLGAYDLDARLFSWDRPAALPHVGADAVLSNLSVATFCVALRAELTASVPLHVYRRLPDGGRERIEDHPLTILLNEEMNPRQTAFEGREMLVRSLDLAGNGFARIDRERNGDVAAVWPSPPGNVAIEELQSGRLRYKFSESPRRVAVLLEGSGEVLHVRAASNDGKLGRSPLYVARGSLALAMAQVQMSQSLMVNSLKPSAVASHPGKLSDKARVNVSDSLQAQAGGTLRAGRMLVLEEGMKLEPWSFSPADAQLLQSRQLSHEDVCRIFAVPPAVAGVSNAVTYGTAVEESRQLVARCIGPLASRVEAALMRDLMSDTDRREGLFLAHDLDGLLRGDLQARFNAYRLAREIGVFSPNDIRRREGESPIPDGDSYIQPLNFAPLGTSPTGSGER